VSPLLHLVLLPLVAGVTLVQAGSAQESYEKSGTHWLRKCTNPEPVWQIECTIYVQAIVEYDEVRAKVLGHTRFICPEKELTIGKSREIVVKFLRDRTQDLHRPFALLAHRALEQAYPCTSQAQ
jgi:hypothetical protein